MRRLYLLVVVAVLAGGCRSAAPAPAPAAASGAPVVIENMALEQEAAESRIVLRSSAPLRWAAGYDDERHLILRFPGAVKGAEAEDVESAAGLVASARLATDDGASPPLTRLSVEPRQEAAYSVRLDEDRLTLFLRPAEGAAAGADPAAPEAAGSSAASGEPRLGPGDVFEIDVFGLPELGRKVRIAGDGTITLPLLGSFKVAGLTPRQAETEIAGRLAIQELVNDPQVSVFVEEFQSRSVSVQGAVRSPGVYQLLGRTRLLDVLSQAGGLSGRQGSEALILRGDGADQRTLTADLDRLLGEGDLAQNLALEPGDVVMVPEARSQRVYVTGAVSRPGPIDFSSSEGITVLQAITAAGGPTARANLKSVKILRRLADGSQEQLEVNVKAIQKGRRDDVPLAKNDTVVVGEWLF